MFVVPGAIAVTVVGLAALTVATAGLSDVHATVCAAPPVTVTDAVTCAVCPTAIAVLGAPEIVTPVTLGFCVCDSQFGLLTGHAPPPPHDTPAASSANTLETATRCCKLIMTP